MSATKAIKLSNGLATIVDAKDYGYFMGLDGFVSYLKGYAYLYLRVGGKLKAKPLHRLINKTPPGYHTDHINGDKLDNRRCNLRAATNSQNAANEHLKRKTNTTGVTGVRKHTSRKGYEVKLCGRYIAYVMDKEDGAMIYRLVKEAWFGEFAP